MSSGCTPEAASRLRFRIHAGSPPCRQRDAACSNARFDETCVPDVARLTGGLLRFFPPAAQLLRPGSAAAVEVETVCVSRRAYVLALAGLRAGDPATYAERLQAATARGATLQSALALLGSTSLPREDAWCLWHDGTVYFAVDASLAKVGRLRELLSQLLPSGLSAVIRSKGGALTSAAATILAARLSVALVSVSLVAMASHVTSAYWELLKRSGLVPERVVASLGEGGGWKRALDLLAHTSLGVSTDVRSTIVQLLMRLLLPAIVTAIAYALDFARAVAEERRWALAEAVMVVARENLHAGHAKTLPTAFLNGVARQADRQSRTLLTALGLHGLPPPQAANAFVVQELQKLADAPVSGGDFVAQLLSRVTRAIPSIVTWACGTTGATALVLNTVTAVPLLLHDVWTQARTAVTPETILEQAAARPQAAEDAAAVRRGALLARADLKVALAQHLLAVGRGGAVHRLSQDLACEYAKATERLREALGAEEGGDADWDLDEAEEPAAKAAKEAEAAKNRAAAATKADALLADIATSGAAATEWPTYAQVELASKLLRASR